MNIETDYKKVYVKEGQYGTMYSTGISNKRQDDSWRTSYINIYFPDGADIKDGEYVKMKGYLVSANDPYKVALRITEYEKKEESKSVQSVKLEDIDYDDDLPF